MKIIKPPEEIKTYSLSNAVFLAGSIEMGKAINWQKEVEDYLSNEKEILLNPRRDDWDSSWTQSSNNINFKEQVEWELHGLENCGLIAMYFASETISPISLCELGLFARTNKLIVCGSDRYKKLGNVEVVCDLYGIEFTQNFEYFKWYIREYVTNK